MQDFKKFYQQNIELRVDDIDLTSHVFHSLTVVQPWGWQHGKLFYLCRCRCGGFAIVKGERLTSGSCHSCGCSKINYCQKTIDIVQARQKAVADAVEKVGGHKSLELFGNDRPLPCIFHPCKIAPIILRQFSAKTKGNQTT